MIKGTRLLFSLYHLECGDNARTHGEEMGTTNGSLDVDEIWSEQGLQLIEFFNGQVCLTCQFVKQAGTQFMMLRDG